MALLEPQKGPECAFIWTYFIKYIINLLYLLNKSTFSAYFVVQKEPFVNIF